MYFFFVYIATSVIVLASVHLSTEASGIQSSDIPRSFSGVRLAYYRWRVWLLNQPANQQKVPPAPLTNEGIHGLQFADVNIRLAPFTIFHVDEAQQTVQLSAKVELWWIDKAFSVDSNLARNFTDGNASLLPAFVSVPKDSVWVPPLFVLEGVQAPDFLRGVEDVQVDSKGKVTIVTGSVLTLSCLFEMTTYPFDEHDCAITVVEKSLTLNVLPSRVPWNRRAAESYSVAGEWQLTGCSSLSITTPYSNATYARFVIHIKRNTTFYVVVVLLPMVVTSYLYVLVFLIPPDLGDKASYLVTITVSLSVFNSFFVVNTPRGIHSSLPRIFLFLLYLNVQSLVVLLLTLVALKQYKTEQRRPEAEVSDTSGSHCRGKGRVAPMPNGDNSGTRRKTVEKLTSRQLDTAFFAVAFVVNTVVISSLMVTMVY